MENDKKGRRPGRREELTQWYAEVLADQASSGLSVAEYAVEIGVTASTLYGWRRRLKDREAGAGRPASPFGLVEVEVSDGRDEGETAASLAVRLGGNRRVEVPRGFDAADLRRLVTVLESC